MAYNRELVYTVSQPKIAADEKAALKAGNKAVLLNTCSFKTEEYVQIQAEAEDCNRKRMRKLTAA